MNRVFRQHAFHFFLFVIWAIDFHTGLEPTSWGQDQADTSREESEAIKKQTRKQESHILFGLKDQNAPRGELYSWVTDAVFHSERRSLVAITGSAVESLTSDSGLIDCVAFELTPELQARLTVVDQLRWLRVSVRNNEEISQLSTLKGLLGLCLEAREPGVRFDFAPISEIKTLQWLLIDVRGADVGSVPALPELEVLSFSDSVFNDRLAEEFGCLPKLRVLVAESSKLSDRGYEQMVKMCPNVEILDLYCSNNLTDAAVVELSKLKKLRYLHIGLTKVGVERFRRLKENLPNCLISVAD